MKQIRRVGDFLSVPLGDGWHTYARVLESPLFAFYDARTNEKLSIEVIRFRPILFRIWVMKHAVTSGRWTVVGNVPLESALQRSPRFFKQDSITRETSIYFQGSEQRATPDQCEGLEAAAVWEPEHVEDRLRDHYCNRPNKWVDSLRIQW